MAPIFLPAAPLVGRWNVILDSFVNCTLKALLAGKLKYLQYCRSGYYKNKPCGPSFYLDGWRGFFSRKMETTDY